MDSSQLFTKALEAAKLAYAPYSKFRVGAALLCADGNIICAANVENRSFGLTICAERSAIVSAIAQGQVEFTALAIACPDATYPVSPCGACRQVLSEFVKEDFPIFFGTNAKDIVQSTMGELFPFDALHDLKS